MRRNQAPHALSNLALALRTHFERGAVVPLTSVLEALPADLRRAVSATSASRATHNRGRSVRQMANTTRRTAPDGTFAEARTAYGTIRFLFRRGPGGFLVSLLDDETRHTDYLFELPAGVFPEFVCPSPVLPTLFSREDWTPRTGRRTGEICNEISWLA